MNSQNTQMPGATWAIGGGKGGVGKSMTSVCLAYWLGRLKRQVILMDADLGGANLHTMLGMRIPERTLDDFILKRVETLDETLLRTSMMNVRLLAGGSDVPALANPNFAQKNRVLRAMRSLRTDELLVDLGAGASLNTLDFFLACPNKMLVMSPQPTSIQNAYGFVKAALFRRVSRVLTTTRLKGLLDTNARSEPPPQSVAEILEEISIGAPEVLDEARAGIEELRFHLVVNMTRNARDEKIAKVIKEVCRKFLGLEIEILGSVPYDTQMERWAMSMEKNTIGRENSAALQAIYEIAYKMVGETHQKMAA